MKWIAPSLAVLLLAGCNSPPGKQHEGQATGWQNGAAVSADGARLQILCLDGEWQVTVRTVERLVPPNADLQWVNRDVTFQFDKQPIQRTKGTLNENRLELNQAEEGTTATLNYGQDVAAGLIRGPYKILTIRTNDGSNRSKEWRFDIEGSRGHIPNNDSYPCPIVGGTAG